MIDKVVEEVHAARKKICEECDYDFKKMAKRFEQLQKQHPENLATDLSKPPEPPDTDEPE